LDEIRKETSMVMIWGGAEYKVDPTGKDVPRAQLEGLIYDGFLRVALFQIPRAGHNHPNAAWYEKALTALERPVGNPHPPATAPTTQPNPSATQLFQAQRILATAKWHVEVESSFNPRTYTYKQAKLALDYLLQNYPNTPAAAEGRQMLEKLAKQPATTTKSKTN
jgi:hypothetical protein